MTQVSISQDFVIFIFTLFADTSAKLVYILFAETSGKTLMIFCLMYCLVEMGPFLFATFAVIK
jgi:hypothetical protein